MPGRPEWATLPTSKICDFDSDMCGFTPKGGADDKKMWRRSTTTKDRSSGPEKAYAGRYFLYLDTSGGKQKQGDARPVQNQTASLSLLASALNAIG